MRAIIRRIWRRTVWLWERAKSEHATPRDIGIAVGLGAFAGCSPAWGVRWAVALGLATLFKKNRLLAYVGSRLTSNFVVTAPVALLEIQLAHKLRTGEFLEISTDSLNDWGTIKTLLLDFCLGSLPVGIFFGLLLGPIAYALAAARDRRVMQRTPAALPPPSSESTP